MTFEEMQVKWSVTLTDRLGPEMLTVLEIKGQVLHRDWLFSLAKYCDWFKFKIQTNLNRALSSFMRLSSRS